MTPRGYRGAGLGRVSYVEAPPEWRGTSVQVCGLYPYIVGGGAPPIGVPLGRNLLGGEAVCFDPINWFRHNLILNPSMFVLGLPALGKSTLVRRLTIGMAGSGVTPLVLGDLKPDYVDTVRALGGQVIRLGRGRGSLNVLEAGGLDQAADRLTGEAAQGLREEAHGRRLSLIAALVVIVRGQRLHDHEHSILSEALRFLTARAKAENRVPLLDELVSVLEAAPESVRRVALDRGRDEEYRRIVDPLQRSLLALLDGPLGQVFARPTTERLQLDAPAACVDVSGISGNDKGLQAAALLACWAEGFGAIEGLNALADAGIAPQRQHFVVLDELWRVLRAGEGMVDRVDELTRLNRAEGVSQAMISHSMADLRALPNAEDREKAAGFVERSGAVICGGLPAQELADLNEIVRFSGAEREIVSNWSTPPGWGAGTAPPGRGNFLLKVGQRPGVPFHVELTQAELSADVHNTNKRWG